MDMLHSTPARAARPGFRAAANDAAATAPDLEVVSAPGQGGAFKVWSHGYPFRTVRWHFHPEYEVHLVTATRGRSFVGDHIGTFAPGNLVVVGPNLPHNWISDLAPGEQRVRQRSIVLQFGAAYIEGCMRLMPELRALEPLLRDAAYGLEALAPAGAHVRALFDGLLACEGPARIGLFFQLLDALRGTAFRRLASPGFRARPERYAGEPMNHVLAQIARNLAGPLSQAELAEASGFSPTAFSRAFRRHTGMTFVRYVNRLRIERACELLMHGDERVTEICFQVGFNNLSNFNRRFLAAQGVAPLAFRRAHRQRGAEGGRPRATP